MCVPGVNDSEGTIDKDANKRMEVKEKGNRGAGDETPYSLSSSNHTNNPSEGKGSIEAKEGDTTAAQTASSRSLHTSDDARRASRISTITPSVLLKADSIREEDLETILDTAGKC